MMSKQIRNLNILLSILIVFSLYGCAIAVIGIGAAGAFAYFNGKLTKTYESEYHHTVRASSATLQELKIPKTETLADALKTQINAKRVDGTPIVIEIIRIEKDLTQVSVRTGSLGVWDKRISEQIHRYIQQNLNRSSSAAQHSSGNLAQDDTQPAIGQPVQPEIIEEDLEDNSVQEDVPSESIADPGSHEQAEKSLKFAEMTADSIFVIFFNPNSNALSEDAIKKLDQVFEILIKNPNVMITLHGYSDSLGPASYNEMISEIRANAVKSYLIGKGAAPSRLKAVGHGSQKFIASNESEDGRQLNRRVEIELMHP